METTMSEYTDKSYDAKVRLAEMSFLEVAYQSRKFLIDEDVITIKIPDEYVKFFYRDQTYSSYNWIHAHELINEFIILSCEYNIFSIDLDEIIKSYINLDIYNKPSIHELISCCPSIRIDRIIDTIRLLQNRFLFYQIKDHPVSEFYKTQLLDDSIGIPDSPEMIKLLHQFFLISCKYGVYFANLIYQIDIDSVIDLYLSNRNRKNEVLYFSGIKDAHISYYDFLDKNYNNDKRLFKEQPTMSRRALEYVEKNYKASTNEKSFNTMINGLITDSYRSNSFKARLIGLWLWDNTKNPSLNIRLSKNEAYSKFATQYPTLYRDIKQYPLVYLNRYLINTEKCIKEGKILKFDANPKK